MPHAYLHCELGRADASYLDDIFSAGDTGGDQSECECNSFHVEPLLFF